MAIFGSSKDKKGQGSSELVLAYLEDAQRLRTPMQLRDPKAREVTANLQSVDEEGGRLTFQLSAPLLAEKGDRIKLIFLHESLRLGAQAKLLELRTGSAVLEIPADLELLERRKKARARLNVREGSTLTALTSLFQGVGIMGVLENISEDGARVKVERAMEAKGERRLNIATGLFPVGHAFMLIKLAKLPKLSAVVELSGNVAYLDSNSGGLSVGVTFAKPSPEVAGAIRGVVSGRVSPLATSVPPKSRRPKEKEAEPTKEIPKVAPVPVQTPEPPAAEVPEAAPVASSPSPEVVQEAPKASPERNAALVRLKKRSRTIVIAMSPDGHRDIVLSHFLEEGYGRVFTAGTLTELLGLLGEQNVSLIFIDGGVAELQGFDLAEALGKVGEAHIPLVLAAEEVSTSTVLNARRVGVDQLIVKPYVMDDTFSALFEQLMELG